MAILELLWEKGRPSEASIELMAEGKTVRIRLIRAVFRRHRKVAEKHGLYFFIDSSRTRLSRRLMDVVEELGPDHVICEARIPWFIARHISRTSGAKLILRPHKIELMDLPSLMHDKLTAPAWANGMTIYTALLAHLSDWTLSLALPDEQLLRSFLISRVTTIEPSYAPMPRGSDEERLARLVEEKSPFFLAYEPSHLYVKLAKTIKDVNFLMVGATSDELVKMLGIPREHMPNNIMAIGYVFGAELSTLFRNALALLIPQRAFSGACMRLIEGLAHGVPILTTTDVANKVVGLESGTHLLVEDDYRRWPRLLRELVRDDELRDLLSRGAETFYREKLRPLVHGQRLEAVLRRISS